MKSNTPLIVALAAAGLVGSAAAQFCPGGNPTATLPLPCGAGAATCFSDFLNPGNPGAGIDPGGFVVAVVDFSDPATSAPGTGQQWCAPMLHNEFPVGPDTWNAANLGQVFGIALDGATAPNIYVTATTTYGSDVAAYQNVFTAALPASPFGPGGAGAVYRLDGISGAISVFATLPNSGPGLGNICFDRSRGTFYVSNFEDGRVYRLSSAGACLSAYDHVTDVVGGCGPEAGDAPGFVPFRERVWGLNVLGDRLYYGLWNEDRGRPDPAQQNEVWSVALDGAGEFLAGTRQLEFAVPSYPGTEWSNPVSDIAFSSAGRMMIAERNMQADVGAGARFASGDDGHRSRDLEYELNGGNVWVPSGRDFFIGVSPAGPGTNAAGGIGYDCDDNLWSTGDQLLIAGNPLMVTYGLQWTPEPGNTIPTIATTGYFVDLDGVSTVQNKNRIGDVEVHNACCRCMSAEVAEIACDFDPVTGLTGKVTVTLEITNDSGTTAAYLLLPNVETVPNVIPLTPPLPSGTGETRTVTFQICDAEPGTTHCLDLLLADATVDECCTIEICVDIPACDCLQLSNVHVDCASNGGVTLSFDLVNLTADVIEHVFLLPPAAPDPNAGVVITPNYVSFVGTPVPPFGGASIGPISITGAVPGTEPCLLVTAHNADLVECCAQELCFDVPDCGEPATGACCLPDGSCIVTTLADCQMQQGLYVADGAPCSECDMITPVGACCLADGSCVVTDLFKCGNLGGVYLGDDSDCADCPAGPVDGACCIPGGCVIAIQSECDAQGGTFLGGGTTCVDCPPTFLSCDIDHDGTVGVSDLVQVILHWGPCPGCPSDVNGDGVVDVSDLVEVILWWGSGT